MLARLRGWARGIRRDVAALALCARDPRVPWFAKALAALVAAYALSPIDLIPDFIPVLGYLDDALIVPLGILAVIRLIPAEVFAENRARAEERDADPRLRWIGAALVAAIWAVAALAALRIFGLWA